MPHALECPTGDELRLFALGELPPDRAEAVETQKGWRTREENQFADEYGRKDDPDKVRLLAE
jgi:hypothetical protein